MSRMLEALKRIEGREPHAGAIDPRAPAVKAAVEEPVPCDAGVPPASEIAGETPASQVTGEVSPTAEVNETLRQLEAIVALAAEPLADVAAEPAWRVSNDLVADPAYARLADNLVAQLIPGRPAAIVFTSPDEQAGTTTTVARLAGVLAQRNIGEILAVDANLERPDLAARLGVRANGDLREVVTGRIPWRDAVRSTGWPGLSVLPGSICDSEGRDPAHLDVGRLIRELAGRFGLVLVDTGALTHAWAGRVTCCCEATYLVVRLGSTSDRMFREAVRVIRRCRGRLRGCIAIGAAE